MLTFHPGIPARSPTPQSQAELATCASGGLRAAARLSHRLEEYLSQLPPDHIATVSAIASQLGPLDPATKQSVVIVAAAHEEGETLLQTLRAYRGQTLSREQFEIALYLNYPAGQSPTPSLEALGRWSTEGQDGLRVVTALQGVPAGTTIGKIRKNLSDAILMRILASSAVQDLVLTRSDADTIFVRPQLLAQHQHLHSTRAGTTLGVKGRVIWDPKALASDPRIAWGHIVWRVVDTVQSYSLAAPLWGGVNCSVRASSYAAVGGFDPSMTLGEDFDFDRRLYMYGRAMMYPLPIIQGGPRSGCCTSARRSVALHKFGDPPIKQWHSPSVRFGPINRTIRQLKTPQPLPREEFLAQMKTPQFELDAAEIAAVTIAHSTTDQNQRRGLRAALSDGLGLHFGQEILPGVLEISNLDTCRNLLIGWYDRHSARGWE